MPRGQELQYLRKLLQVLDKRFSEGGLRTLCFHLGVDYDSLPGEGKANKARELVAYLERRGRIPELVETGKQLRPDVSWGETSKERKEAPSIFQDIPTEQLQQTQTTSPLITPPVPQDSSVAHFTTASQNGTPVDFIIITALEEERDAVLDKLPGHQKLVPSENDIRVYYRSDLPVSFPDGSTGTYRVVVMPLLGMGRLQAATATSDAIRLWRPRYMVLIGIAGGIAARGVELGDILVSDQIVDYELQKLTPASPEIRWQVHRADPRLVGAARNFGGEEWQELIKTSRPVAGEPKRHIGPIASGDKVIAFSEVLAGYRDTWPKLIGVEMEAAGAAAATFQAAKPPGFFMVRGVSDSADEEKGSDYVEKWRLYACDVAASYVIALLKSGPILSSPVGETSPTMSSDASREPQRTKSLDTQILQVLYAYFQQHLGDPKINLSELITLSKAKQADVIQCLYGLQKKEWLDFNLTEGAESGLVWLTQLGIRVAKDVQQN